MSLYWPPSDSDIVTDDARLHALVVGVDDYDHLGLGVPKPSRLLAGLAPLTITTPAARCIAQWLETDYNNPDCPLGSVELLLSPGQTLTRDDGSQVTIDTATMANITAAFKSWYARCDSDANNIAFFYFAGHGISTISQFLLPADFGDPDEPDDWENCIDASGMQAGMAKCKAQTQLFFLDACRDAPISALTQNNPHGKPLVNSDFSDSVDLSAAYTAAAEGRQAFGRDGEETFFCQALIMCLEGMAARKPGPQWQVDAASLSMALVSVIESLAALKDEPLRCECKVQKPVPLHFPTTGKVLVKVDCDDPAMNAEAEIQMTQGTEVLTSQQREPLPWAGVLEPGEANIRVKFEGFPDQTIDDQMLPPTYNLDLPL